MRGINDYDDDEVVYLSVYSVCEQDYSQVVDEIVGGLALGSSNIRLEFGDDLEPPSKKTLT